MLWSYTLVDNICVLGHYCGNKFKSNLLWWYIWRLITEEVFIYRAHFVKSWDCLYIPKTKVFARLHREYKHEGVIYTWKFKHVGIKYDSGQCDYKGAEHSKLKYHKQRKHEGVKIFFTTLCRVKNIYNLSMRVLAIPAISVSIR